jgi:hypothetical protein
MSKGFKVAVVTICFVVATATLLVHRDTQAIRMRDTKAADLVRAADRLGNSHLSTVLAELGSPTRVQLMTAPSRETQSREHYVLVFIYEYRFQSVPWRTPQRVWITFRFDERLRSTTAWVDQTFS